MSSRQIDEEAIFHTARLIDNPEGRSLYLGQICAGDQKLRERVEALLDVHEQEAEFLKSSPEDLPTVDHSPITEAPGHQIGRFKLLQQIGEGGFGLVYMAEQTRPVRRKVALKIIKPGMDTHAVVARFEAERQTLALMNHPNIARVIDGGTTDTGRPYFVMELVRGVPVTEYCDKNNLSPRDRLELFITICEAVHHAHQKGIIHRDLKPSNILITLADGKPVVKVIDFGVSKALNQQLTEKTLFTAYGQMIGTPQYMSPEQAEMSCLDVDTRSDIYSLGVLLYELLTGTTPLERERLRTAGYAEMQRIIREEAPPKPSLRLSSAGERLTVIAEHRSATPERLHKIVRGDLDWIVMKALEKERGRRYETANSLSDDVQRFLNEEAVLAYPPSTVYRFRKFASRNKLAMLSAIALALTLLLAATVSTWQAVSAESARRAEAQARRQAEAERHVAETERLRAKAAEESARAEVRRRQRLHRIADMNVAQQSWDEHDVERVRRLLETHRLTAREHELSEFESRYLSRLCKRQEARALPHEQNVAELTFAPQGKILATLDAHGAVRLWDHASGTLVESFGERGVYGAALMNYLTFSPDGKLLAYPTSRGKHLVLREMKTGQPRPLENCPENLRSFTFSPDNRYAAAGGIDGFVHVWDLFDNKHVGELNAHTGEVRALRFTHQTLISAGARGVIKLWEVGSWKAVTSLSSSEGVTCADASADGRYIATGGWDGTVRLWDLETRDDVVAFRGHLDEVRAVAFFRNDQLLASGSRDGSVAIWDVIAKERVSELKHAGAVNAVAYCPKTDLLASAGTGPAKIWDLHAIDEVNVVRESDAVESVAFVLPEGRQVLVHTRAGILKMRDAIDPSEPTATFGSEVSCFAVSSGREIAVSTNGASLQILQIPHGREIETIRLGRESTLNKLDFSPDGSHLALGYHDGVIVLIDRATGGEQVIDAHQDSSPPSGRSIVSSMSFSPNGQALASGGRDGKVKLWDVQTGSLLRTLDGHTGWIESVMYSPDGQSLASSSWDTSVRLWDLSDSAAKSRPLEGHALFSRGLAFSPDGRTLFSTGGDRVIRVWDTATGLQRFSLRGHASAVNGIDVSPDGETLVSWGRDKRIRFWRSTD